MRYTTRHYHVDVSKPMGTYEERVDWRTWPTRHAADTDAAAWNAQAGYVARVLAACYEPECVTGYGDE